MALSAQERTLKAGARAALLMERNHEAMQTPP